MSDLSRSIAESGYVGWVVTLADGSVLFEATKRASASPTRNALLKDRRPESRSTVLWSDVPHERVERLEVYGFHDAYSEQPLIRLDREPGANVRYCVLTMSGLVLPMGGSGGVRHLGVTGWKVGWYNIDRSEFDLWEITQSGRNRLDPAGGYASPDGPAMRGDPRNPSPLGFGIAGHAFGLDRRVYTNGGSPARQTLK